MILWWCPSSNSDLHCDENNNDVDDINEELPGQNALGHRHCEDCELLIFLLGQYVLGQWCVELLISFMNVLYKVLYTGLMNQYWQLQINIDGYATNLMTQQCIEELWLMVDVHRCLSRDWDYDQQQRWWAKMMCSVGNEQRWAVVMSSSE